jgi:predicted dehydrogenase
VNPKTAGNSFVLGDLSTHTYYMSRLICPDINIKQILCDRQSFIKSRAPLEDNAYCLMHYDNGAVGRLWTSSVNAGYMNSQKIRIVGSKASIEFNDTQPNELIYEVQGQPPQRLIRGMPYLYDECNADERLGALHTDGLIESWSNIYLKFAIAMDAKNRGDEATLKALVYPGIDAGIDGIRWVQNCVKSADAGSVWVDFE